MRPAARAAAVAAILAAALATLSCGAALLTLPTGAGTPASDALPAFTTATAACRGITSFSAEVAVAGSVAGRRVPRGRLLVGLAAPALARLEAPAPFGAPGFIFVARGDDATLLLPRDRRVLAHGRPRAVLEALTGVPLDAADLRMTLTGCAPQPSPDALAAARQLGADWRRIDVGAGALYLHRANSAGAWQLAAVTRRDPSGAEWRADYSDYLNGLPRSVRLASLTGSTDRTGGLFDLRLTLSQVEANVALGPEVFEVDVPAAAEPMTLDDLRAAGPLGQIGAK